MTTAERARDELVDALRESARLRSPAVEQAFRTVPRHLFLPDEPVERAYADEAIAVAWVDGAPTSSASQPSMMAIMLEQLDLRPGHRVLEIGAGTGYNAALMAHVVGPSGHVTSVDIDAELVERAGRQLAAVGTTGVTLCCADGAFGHAAAAPYDRIVLTVGSDDVRPEWVAQLAAGGRLLLPLGMRGNQVSVALDLAGGGLLRSVSVTSCGFIRLRGAGAGPEAAVALTADGLSLRTGADTPAADVARLRDTLAAPGPSRPTGLRLGARDLFDGLGLWLTLTEPTAHRVIATGPAAATDLAAGLIPLGADRGSLLLVGDDDARAGAAMVVVDPGMAGFANATRPVHVRAFGPAGTEAADRLAALLDRWAELGRPTAAELSLVISPVGGHPVDAPAPSSATVLEKEHSRVLVSWADPGSTD